MKKILNHFEIPVLCLIFEKNKIRFQTLLYKNQVRDRESRHQSAKSATAPNPGTRSFVTKSLSSLDSAKMSNSKFNLKVEVSQV